MPGLLEGQIANAIYKGFKNKLLKGTLRRDVPSSLDARGDPVSTSPLTWGMQGFVDLYSESFRAQFGVPDTDAIVNIFAKSLPSGVQPTKDDKVLFRSQWYQLRTVSVDPALALWMCQRSFVIPAPSDVS